MTIAVKLSGEIFLAAQTMSKALNRSVTGQIEYWAKIGKIGHIPGHTFVNYWLVSQLVNVFVCYLLGSFVS